jgi:4-hydroxy-tetrahydrodipicolinate synthase
MRPGCYTAIITPFSNNTVDYDDLLRLVNFQVENGVAGVLAAGTTGESPTLQWDEHNLVTERIAKGVQGKAMCVAGTGSNNTAETLSATKHAVKAGAEAVLLVDPYYNGPSSLEIRKEYLEPVARAFPGTTVIPYIIPGRTGAQVLPEDIALANAHYGNISVVKEATADLDNMRRTRACCGDGVQILSGDDNMTLQMMTDPDIRACGVISVYSNIFPQALSQMVAAVTQGDLDTASRLEKALRPLLESVTVTTTEKTPHGDASCRARNPVPVKTLMTVLGMPAGSCRRPLGKMTSQGLDQLLSAAQQVYANAPELFAPLAAFFDTDVEARLNDPQYRENLVYDTYS